MEPVEKLPGLTFYVERSKLSGKVGEVLLTADVEDPELWEQTVKKLNNFRVYSVANLQTALVEVLQEENTEQKEAHARELATLRERLEHAESQLSFYKEKERGREKEEIAFAAELKKLREQGIGGK